MIDLTQAYIEAMIIHSVGNQSRGEPLTLSEHQVTLNQNLESAFLKFFFNPFHKDLSEYYFFHEESLNLNEMYSYVSDYQRDIHSFEESSRRIARFLYRITNHPNILSGDLIFALIKKAQVNNHNQTILGIFKSEQKSKYIDICKESNNIYANLNDGIDIGSLDKGTLIFLEKDEPFLCVHNNRKVDSTYWNDSFIKCQLKDDDKIRTKIFIDACVSFSKEIGNKNNDKSDIANINSRITEYFNERKAVDVNSFTSHLSLSAPQNEVLKKHIESVEKKYKIDLNENFNIDKNKTSVLKKRLEKIIKLDTKIDIRIHSDSPSPRNLIEKGFDKNKGMSYYKIFFNEES